MTTKYAATLCRTDIEIQARQLLRLKALLTRILAKRANQPLNVF